MKKKLFAAVLAFTLVIGLGACGSPDGDKEPDNGQPGIQQGQDGAEALSGSFEDIIQSLYDKVGYDVETANTEVTSENAEFYLGSSDIKFKKALASEPVMSSIAHSVVLLEAEDGADLSAVKKKIKEEVNGYKWICVGVENILVDNVGNYIMLVMDEDAKSFMDAFLEMGK